MNIASIAIGGNWGDEGKGHEVDILCANKPSTLNVRFNGGSQASHTVVTPDGKRHAFRHFGAGTFAGAITYLSEDFIVNVMEFDQERRQLAKSFDVQPLEYVNPNCIVTTPWDIYINQGIEALRGNKRHGSCGLGINETVIRSMYDQYKITVLDFFSLSKLKAKLEKIQDEYVALRLKTEYNISISDIPEKYRLLLTRSENIDIFMFYVNEFISNVQVMDDSVILRWDNVVFEGAQGLLLDQNNRQFAPYLTTSNTGIKNVMKILKNVGYTGKTDIYYLSRCYMTRHGAGPFPTEVVTKPYSKIEDLTNIPNEFQGTLRFGILDIDLLSKSINKDLEGLVVPASVYVTLTCFDQLGDIAKYKLDGQVGQLEKELFLNSMSKILMSKIGNLNGLYATSGLTRQDLISVLP
jgi:adenylosuccinate synthase